ncbi:uncharacterized protein PRCAT00001954001 [Priceomyces carsonii]|uniref:uncharacterized protein n=1 Tax=Priceomyces carsonii TaxID=28549 RepID=UPI002EDA6840|nr:unnamed protein product [Priceomyces carsonii]
MSSISDHVDAQPDLSPTASNTSNLSRRQRLLGLAKATRDTYIPRISGSVSQIASGVSSRAFGTGNDLYDEDGNFKWPKDTSITLFPSYTRHCDGYYYTDVKGWLSCPGLMTRKNRLILSLAKQVIRYNSDQAVNKLESERLRPDVLASHENSSSDLDSLQSDSSSLNTTSTLDALQQDLTRPPTNSSMLTHGDDLIRERLKSFMARSIPDAELLIVVGAEDGMSSNDLVHLTVVTDINGHFETRIKYNYKPSILHVRANDNEFIFAFQDIMLVPNTGVGVISDIDDTVKLTGVIGDKRELMTTLLLKDMSLWCIPRIAQWFNELNDRYPLSFHYVSNSPWEMFTTISQYFKIAKLPPGSIHLKQYTGNIIGSFMESRSSRKKRALNKILDDFPHKKFICVGDSGEQDLEAYVDLAKNNPNNIAKIYIRYVADSLSYIDDMHILDEIKRLVSVKKSKSKHIPPKHAYTISNDEIENLIDLSDSPSPLAAERLAKLPPMIPKKPTNLKGNLVRKPPLPSRDKYLSRLSEDQARNNEKGDIKNSPGEMTSQVPRSKTSSSVDSKLIDNLHNIYYSHNYDELEDTDKKGAQWIHRVLSALTSLEGLSTDLEFFTDEDEEFFEKSASDIQKLFVQK